MKTIISDCDLKKTEDLIRTTISKEVLYDKLCQLECEGKKDSLEYKRNLEYLKVVLEVLNNQYKDLDYYKCVSIADYLIKYKLNDDVVSVESIISKGYNNYYYEGDDEHHIYPGFFDIDSIISVDTPNRVVKSILCKLIYRILSLNKNLNKENDKNDDMELFYIVPFGVLAAKKRDKNIDNSLLELREYFEMDVLSAFMYFIEENIKMSKGMRKDVFIKAKYNTAFIHCGIESVMLYNDFDIPESLLLTCDLIPNVKDMNLELYKVKKDNYSVMLASLPISNILDMDSKDYFDKDKTDSVLLCQCLIRAAFLMMEEDCLYELNNRLYEFIDNNDVSVLSREYIVQCFKKAKSDKEVPCRLSLR